MRSSKSVLLTALVATILLPGACSGGGRGVSRSVRSFPEVRLPAMLSQDEVADYVLDHFWDAYLDTTGRYFCDSSHVGGVDERIVATQLASFLSILENSPAPKAGEVMGAFFERLERCHAADTASNVFDWMTEAVEYYLYDPNSDIRSEELFLPFISRLAQSPFAREELRTRYAHEAAVCATNRIGAPAPDFSFVDAQGRRHTLYGERAPLTVLLFVNPGCRACEEVVSAFEGEGVKALVREGKLRILGVYIDEDIQAWRDQSAELPAHWINGYEPDGLVRSDKLYYVRGIPSIYLLDADKHILMKDALPEAVVAYIGNADL